MSKVLPFPYPSLYLDDYENDKKICPRFIQWVKRVKALNFSQRNKGMNFVIK